MARKWSFLIGCLALSLLLVACPLSLASAGIDYGDIDGEWASNLLEKLESAIQESEGQAVDFSEIDLMLQTSTLYHECYDREPGGDGDAHMALGYLTNWRGPVVATGEATLGPSIEPACYVQGAEFLPSGGGSQKGATGAGKPSLGNLVFTRVDMSKRYDNIHQHDVLGYNYPLKVQPRSGSVWFANVFPVKTRHGEILKAVSFYTLTGNTKYEVRLVTNFTGPASLSGGIKVAEGTLASAGYHTIDLDSNTNLSYGSSFAVVVRLTAKGIREIAADSAKGWSVKNSVSQAGESFVRVNSSWRDLHWIEPNTNVCLKAFTVDAPVPASELMNPADMLAELEYVLGRMRADNPAVRRSGFSAEQLATIDDVRASISFPLSRQDYYFQLQRVFAMLGECQTNIWTSPSESFYLNLPFVWLMDDGIVIQQDAAPLAKGDTVLSIGGAAPDQLIRMLSRIVSAENEYWLRHAARSVLQRGSYLDYFGLVNPDRTVDVAILREGKAKVYRIPLGRSYPGPYERPVITWRIEEENNLGYLRFDVFPHRDEMASLLQEIDSFFGAVRQKGIPNIVIDWRYAGGGYAHVLHDFLGYFEGGPIYIEGHRLYDITKRPEGETFKGSTYVLTSNRTFGATVIGAMLLHDNGIGVTVGEPIGAKPNFSGSNRSDERLPVTGWTARISNLAPMRPRDFDSTATTLEPDIPVYTSHDDFMAGRDPQMELVRRMCTGKF